MYNYQMTTSLVFRIDSIEGISEYLEDATEIVFIDPQTITFKSYCNLEFLIITLMQSQLIDHTWTLEVIQTDFYDIEEYSYGGSLLLVSFEAPQIVTEMKVSYHLLDKSPKNDYA